MLGLIVPNQKPMLGTPLYHQDGLAGSLLMNEGDGGIAYDTSGSGNHCILANGMTWDTKNRGLCITGDGASYATFQSVPITSYPYSISCWFQVSVAPQFPRDALVSIADSSTYGDYQCLFCEGYGAYVYVGLLQRYNAGSLLNTNSASGATRFTNWLAPHQACAVVVSDTERYIYGDGKLLNSDLVTNVQIDGMDKAGIGALVTSTPAAFLKAGNSVSSVKIANRVWSPSEVNRLYEDEYWMYRHDPIELWSATSGGGAPPATNQAVWWNHYNKNIGA